MARVRRHRQRALANDGTWQGSRCGIVIFGTEPTAPTIATARNVLEQRKPSVKARSRLCGGSLEFTPPGLAGHRARVPEVVRARFSRAGVREHTVGHLQCEFGVGLSLKNRYIVRYKKAVVNRKLIPVQLTVLV